MPVRRWALGATLLLSAAFIALVALPDHRGDGTYYAVGRLLLTGRLGPQVYDDAWMLREVSAQTGGRVSDVFRPNPPTAALLALPVAWLPPEAARRAWAVLNVLLLYGMPALVGRVAFGRAVAGSRGAAAPWLAALAFALFADPIVEGFQLGQAYILLLALFGLAWWGLRRGRSAAAGLGLALAFMLKTSGGPLWLLLIMRRDWRALAWAAGGCLAVFGLSLPWIGLDLWRVYLGEVLPAAAASPTVAVTAFQSVPGFWAHLLRFDAEWNPAPLADLPGLAAALGLASAVLVLGLSLAVARRAPLGPAFGTLAAASVVLVPFAEQHHYTLLALPLALAAAGWSRTRAPLAGAVLALGGLLVALPLPYESPALAAGWRALLAYPRLYGGLLVWGVLLHFAARPSKADGA